MAKSELVGYIDSSGAVIDGVVPVLVPPKIHSPFGRFWVQANQEFLSDFSECQGIGAEGFRVFLKLLGKMEFENVIRIPQAEVARELGMKRQNVNRAVQQLVKIGVLTKEVKRGSSWKLNPTSAWKGRVSNLHKAHRSHLRVVK